MRVPSWRRAALGFAVSVTLTTGGLAIARPGAAHAAVAPPSDPVCVGGVPQALDHYRAALQTAATEPVDVMFVGDSLTEGFNATADPLRWVELARDQLQNAHNPTGVDGGLGFLPAVHTFDAWPTRWRFGSTHKRAPAPAYVTPTEGLALRSINLTAEAQFAELPFTGDRIWLAYTVGPTRGSFAVSIDGARVATVNANAPAPLSGRIWASGPLGAGAHTLRVTPVVVKREPTNVLLDGAMVFAGDGGSGPGVGRGVRTWELGRAAATSAWFATIPAAAHHGTEAIRPDAIVIGLGANDINTMTAATYRANLSTIIDRFRNGGPGMAPQPDASIVLWVQPRRAGDTASVWQPFVDAVYAVAREKGAAVLDVGRRLGPADDGPLWADAIHPTDEGHRAIADAIVQGLDLGVPCEPIVGRLTDTSGAPADAVCVYAFRTGETDIMGATFTAPDGTFTIHDLNPGTYDVAFHDCSNRGRGAEWYVDSEHRTGATPVPTGGEAIEAILGTASEATDPPTTTETPTVDPGTLAGRVVDDAGRPVDGHCVYLFDAGAANTDRIVRSAADGAWSFSGLTPGAPYELALFDCVGRDLVPEWFRDRGDRTQLTTVTPGRADIEAVVSLPSPTPSADPAALAGRITDPSRAPIEGICVYVFDEGASDTTRMVRTAGDGSWALTGLTAGARYQLGFYDCSGQGFSAEWYGDAPTLSESTPVSAGTAGVAAVMSRPPS